MYIIALKLSQLNSCGIEILNKFSASVNGSNCPIVVSNFEMVLIF